MVFHLWVQNIDTGVLETYHTVPPECPNSEINGLGIIVYGSYSSLLYGMAGNHFQHVHL